MNEAGFKLDLLYVLQGPLPNIYGHHALFNHMDQRKSEHDTFGSLLSGNKGANDTDI